VAATLSSPSPAVITNRLVTGLPAAEREHLLARCERVRLEFGT